MSKVSIVYWSGTGNTAMMAGSIADGVAAAGGEAELITVDEASVDALKDASVIALGCPSMGAEQLEETQMEPFMCSLIRKSDMRAMLMRVPRCSNIQPRMKSTALLLKDSINWAISTR